MSAVASPRAGRALVVVALIFCAFAAGCARSAPAAERAGIDGRLLFAQACAKCHGADGTGGLPMVADGPRPANLTAADWQRSRSDAEIIATLRDGRGAMPPFKDVISAEQIAALAAYVRTLQRP